MDLHVLFITRISRGTMKVERERLTRAMDHTRAWYVANEERLSEC